MTVVLIANVALAAAAAIVGLLLVKSSIGWFVRMGPGSIGSVDAIGVDGALLAYLSLVAVVTALVFGLVPAVTASRATLSHTLSSGTSHATAGKRQALARRALVIGELAIALVFLTGAGLVAKTISYADAAPSRAAMMGEATACLRISWLSAPVRLASIAAVRVLRASM